MDNIVRKPWGYEYVAFQNDSVALKVLHIKKGERTSLHCHPNKSTGLVVIEGTAILNFIADQCELSAPSKKMIRRGLFHQTIAQTDLLMLEIESPVDKDDLVRLKDQYGRKELGYEDHSYEVPRAEDCVTFSAPESGINQYNVGAVKIAVGYAKNMSDFQPDDIIMFLQGGVNKLIDGRLHFVIQPGDVGHSKIVSQVLSEMDGFSEDTILLIINEHK